MSREILPEIVPEKPLLAIFHRISKDFKKNWFVYLMVLPVVTYYLIFYYVPMYGIQIGFKDFNIAKGYSGSPWVGLKYFKMFFDSFYLWRVLRNTVLINLYELIFSFPAPILFALLLNEVKNRRFKKYVQTISYLPHFISTVVICGIITNFCVSDGLINDIISLLGGERNSLLQNVKYFRTIFIASGIWQGLGFSSIIYFAAISAVDQELYQSAIIDGASRFRQVWHITLPSIKPTIIILLILNIGGFLNVGFQKIILLYNPATYEVADVISSHVYTYGLQKLNWSYGAAVGLFNSVANLILLIAANRVSKKVSEISLW